MKRHLFVGGPPRSGTTALARLLNAHPEIAIGIERYKSIYRSVQRRPEIGEELFRPERFCDVRDGDTDRALAQQRELETIEQKLPHARYVGDKFPYIIAARTQIRRTLNHARFLYIIRDPRRVASSWNVRASDSSDRWPAGNNSSRAVETMNSFMKVLGDDKRAHPESVGIVGYDSLFGRDGHKTLEALLGWLDLGFADEIRCAYEKALDKAEAVRRKKLSMSQAELDYLEREIDWEVYNGLDFLTDERNRADLV